VRRTRLEFRVGQVVRPHQLRDCVVDLRGARTDGSEALGEGQGEFAIRHNARAALLERAKPFVYRSSLLSAKVTRALKRIMDDLQQLHPNEVFNISMFALCLEVERLIQSQFDPSVSAMAAKRLSPKVPPPGDETLDSVPAELLYAVICVMRDIQSFPTIIDRDHASFVTFVAAHKQLKLRRDLKHATAKFDRLVNLAVNHGREFSQLESDDPDVSKVVDLIRRYAIADIDDMDLTLRSMAVLVLKRLAFCAGDEEITPETAMRLLTALGAVDAQRGPLFEKWCNDFAHRPVTLGSSSLEKADICGSMRAESRASHALAIDDKDAHEIDDAVSLTPNSDGTYTVGVHIADPVSVFSSFASEHIEHAYRATTSVYWMGGTRPMFDNQVVGAVDLGIGEHKPVRCLTISFKWDPSRQTADPTSATIAPEILTRVQRISYDKVDSTLARKQGEHSQDLATLLDISATLARQRRQAGALFLSDKTQLRVDEDDDRGVSTMSTSPARGLVAELMIMANHIVAEFVTKNNIPALYRTQHEPEFSKTLQALRSDSVVTDNPWQTATLEESLHILQYLSRAVMTTRVAPHDSLALKSYTHSTSPLRRFQDLVLHHQIHSYLLDNRGRMMNDSQLQRIALHINTQQQVAKRCTRNAQHFNILQHLSTRLGSVVDGLVAGVSAATTTILLREYGVRATLDEPRPLKIGTPLRCMIKDINPFTYSLVLRPCT
jgi:hypothetical protein